MITQENIQYTADEIKAMVKTIEELRKKYNGALERAKKELRVCGSQDCDAARQIFRFFPELKESEDERMKSLIQSCVYASDITPEGREEIFAWLEKQGEPNPYSGVSFKYNGHIWGMCARDNGVDILLDKQLFKHLEKQGEILDKDKLAKEFLRSVATSIMNWLDANTSEGKMCLSNMECEDIENAVRNADWSKIYAYMRKKLEKQESKESEDEKIRKVLIEYFGEQCDMSDWNGVYGYEVYDWLKKTR